MSVLCFVDRAGERVSGGLGSLIVLSLSNQVNRGAVEVLVASSNRWRCSRLAARGADDLADTPVMQ